jgi:hypothetical protein
MIIRRLSIFVEGAREKLFFDRILRPALENKYNYIEIIEYSQEKIKWEYINDFINSIKRTDCGYKKIDPNWAYDYIFIADIDNSPCKTAKKEELRRKIPNLEQNKIIIVVKEIESWYLAGLDEKACRKLRIGCFNKTDDIMKEHFESIYYKSIHARRPITEFYLNIIENYSIDIAKRKNGSFKYFCNKFSI